MGTMNKVGVLGVPMDLGAGRRGVDMGPSAIRYAQLHTALRQLGYAVLDYGDVEVPVVETLSRKNGRSPGGLHHLQAIRQACEETVQSLKKMPEDTFPIVLGGDHSISMGSITGASRGERIGVIWVDAHGDFNTPETSPSGNIHGMPLAALCGFGDPQLVNIGWEGAKVRPEDVVLIGIRELDPGEKLLLREAGVTVYTMKEVDQLGISRIAAETIERFRGLPKVHVSLDADVLDPTVAPGVGTPVPGGLSYREAHLLMELLAEAGIVTSLDLVEVNPILDQENRTAEIMVELAASLLGKQIF
ncbi:arginase [Marinithermus hydrothermalis]|uniref:Arginase n=1 Tax=Marinithermus hydrothermalis (strain DSM 14884 / JCM 11576 / T1) TaxID=869210 RepID=F2NP08_MARHT|nr:arginase [Marinithermus hydrothermalis DSM 14884]